MRILGRAFFTYLIPVLLFGCVSVNKVEVSDTEFEEQLGRGSLRLTCGVSCAFGSGFYGDDMKTFHDLELWLDLAKQVYSIGFEDDQGYYYLGRAAEGFGYHDAALTYYRLAKSNIQSCDGVVNNCKGLVFPDDIDRRVQNLSPRLNYSNDDVQIAVSDNGQGTEIGPDGRVGRNGIWRDSKLITANNNQIETTSNIQIETINYPNGNVYVGEVRNGLFNGQGTYTFASGSVYVGEYRDGQRNGQGTFTIASGSVYVGEFRDGQYNGQGTLTSASGSVYVGEYRDGQRNGQGTYTSAGGRVQNGIWRDNELITENDN